MGYNPTPMVDRPGVFSRRGGVIDIFTPGLNNPVRLELLGDEIESIREFDLNTQRSLMLVEHVTIFPASEVVPNHYDRKVMGQLSEGINFSECDAPFRDRITEELDALAAGISFDYADYYSGYFNEHTLLDHVESSGRAMVVLCEPHEIDQSACDWSIQRDRLFQMKLHQGELPKEFPSNAVDWSSLANVITAWSPSLRLTRYRDPSSDNVDLNFNQAKMYQNDMDELVDDLRANGKSTVIIATQHSQRMSEILSEAGIGVRELRSLGNLPPTGGIFVVHAQLAQGWTFMEFPDDADPLIKLITDRELFGGTSVNSVKRAKTSRRAIDLDQLNPGDHVVHIDHGIARFSGVETIARRNSNQEYLVLSYANEDRLYVPLDQLNRIAHYRGGKDPTPALTRLGTQEWGKIVGRARESTRRLAFDLLKIYAEREVENGHPFTQDTPWQTEMEDAFPFEPTPGQLQAIDEVKRDMQRGKPMDRLICGDVGYGKTEVAIRATFKAVMDNKQVAILVPTTVLAQQHYDTFSERLGPFPVRVELLSRFRTRHEQNHVIRDLRNGDIDVVIGTHRLLQKDVSFRDLGLVIIDEEHRFGVQQKETMKDVKKQVDILTMTATPIPRTLHMAMTGIRDISLIATPPEDRLPIKTYLGESSDELIQDAILREIDRGGQVFYLHNRIRSIEFIRGKLNDLVPQAKVLVAHAQMPEQELVAVMSEFRKRGADVLLCTTIIESGLDLPAVNTIIIDRADRFGLAQLYQLRGRIGRRSQRGYAYMLVPKGQRLSGTSLLRLEAILSASDLGSGFQIANSDLEIRGAGNILGAEQSGYIHAVGLDLYTKLLSKAVSELREDDSGAPRSIDDGQDISIDLDLDAFVPDEFIEDLPTRMNLYRQMVQVNSFEEVDDLEEEWADRFGRLPEEMNSLVFQLRVRLAAWQARASAVVKQDGEIHIKLIDEIGGIRIPLERAVGYGGKVGNTRLRFRVADLEEPDDTLKWGSVLLDILARIADLRNQYDQVIGDS